MLSSLRRKAPFERRDKSLVVPSDMLPVLERGGVPTLREALPRLSNELDRARRHSRPLSVVVFGLDPVATDMGRTRFTSEPSVAASAMRGVAVIAARSASAVT